MFTFVLLRYWKLNIKSFYDVIVVGGGPSGSMAAYEIAKAGYSVCVFDGGTTASENHRTIKET